MTRKKIAVTDTQLPAIAENMPDWLQELVARTNIFSLEIPTDPDGLMQIGVSFIQSGSVQMAAAGWCFSEARNKADYGSSFIVEAARPLGIGKDTLYRAIKVFEFMGYVASKGKVACCENLEQSKICTLARLDNETLDHLLTDGHVYDLTLEDVQTLPVRDVERRIRDLRSDIVQMRKKHDQYLEVIARQDRELEKLRHEQKWQKEQPEVVTNCRNDGMAMILDSLDTLTRLDSMQHSLLEGKGLSGNSEQRQAELRHGITPIETGVAAVMAQAEALLKSIHEGFDKRFLPADRQPMLTADESKEAITRCNVMLSGVKLLLQDKEKPKRKPGRPAKNRQQAK